MLSSNVNYYDLLSFGIEHIPDELLHNHALFTFEVEGNDYEIPDEYDWFKTRSFNLVLWNADTRLWMWEVMKDFFPQVFSEVSCIERIFILSMAIHFTTSKYIEVVFPNVE